MVSSSSLSVMNGRLEMLFLRMTARFSARIAISGIWLILAFHLMVSYTFPYFTISTKQLTDSITAAHNTSAA
ncbi:hypothetical protein CBFG_06067 [Clostridiales bacterium 1_7_47FAA]|nr:hypothetical protein CBFG_06067 [Clostridiales bacterium 1_7_47FAA]